jgi:hypothetical protein
MKSEITLVQLKWITILAPLAFLGALEFVRWWSGPGLLTSWPGYVLLAGIVLLGVLLFSQTIFSVIERLQQRLRQQNHELLALHHASLAIESQLDLQALLQGVVDEARSLLNTKYGALSYLREDGEIDAFLTSGISPEERELIGPPPRGHGLLGVVIATSPVDDPPARGADPVPGGGPGQSLSV